MDVQGHRGARGLYPENTIIGFIEALKLGVNTLELDVVMSQVKPDGAGGIGRQRGEWPTGNELDSRGGHESDLRARDARSGYGRRLCGDGTASGVQCGLYARPAASGGHANRAAGFRLDGEGRGAFRFADRSGTGALWALLC